MKNAELVQALHGAELPRRNFLRTSLLMAVPAALAASGMPHAVASITTSAYAPPRRTRGAATVDVRNFGALGNGSNDDTTAFQRAIDSLPSAGGTVTVPAGNYVIDPTRKVRLRSKMHLKLASGATLRAKRNSADRAYVLMVYKVSNVEISGGQIIGDRDAHLGTTGEWGHGIQVLGASRVTVRDIKVSRCWGDGVCVGGAMVANADPIPSEDVVIANIVSTGNRRHGLTIANAHNVKVYDSEFSNSHGLSFGCGIDIEPSNSNTATNMHIENCLIENNASNGILVYKRVSGTAIKKCTIARNGGYGILTIAPRSGYVAQNRIRHNYLEGLMLRAGTRDYQASGNYFRNNKTRLHGVNTSGGRAVPMTGLVGGNRGTGAHIQKTSDCIDIRVTTNYYAK